MGVDILLCSLDESATMTEPNGERHGNAQIIITFLKVKVVTLEMTRLLHVRSIMSPLINTLLHIVWNWRIET